jgi:hypothetical protein
MKIRHIPQRELRRLAQAAERERGPTSNITQAFQRELERRRARQRKGRQRRGAGESAMLKTTYHNCLIRGLRHDWRSAGVASDVGGFCRWAICADCGLQRRKYFRAGNWDNRGVSTDYLREGKSVGRKG